MSLSTFDYVNKLLKVAADALEIQYTKQTPTSLQNWCRDNSGVFVANVGMTESRSPINTNLDFLTFSVSLYFVVSRDYEVTEEDKLRQESDARDLASKYIYLLKKNKYCTVQNNGFDLIFREGGYLGLGIAGTVSVSLPDRDSNCDEFCNNMTVDVEC
jgi:hypothetical protein